MWCQACSCCSEPLPGLMSSFNGFSWGQVDRGLSGHLYFTGSKALSVWHTLGLIDRLAPVSTSLPTLPSSTPEDLRSCWLIPTPWGECATHVAFSRELPTQIPVCPSCSWPCFQCLRQRAQCKHVTFHYFILIFSLCFKGPGDLKAKEVKPRVKEAGLKEYA